MRASDNGPHRHVEEKEPQVRCSEYGARGEYGCPGVDPMASFSHVTLFVPGQGQGPFQTQNLKQLILIPGRHMYRKLSDPLCVRPPGTPIIPTAQRRKLRHREIQEKLASSGASLQPRPSGFRNSSLSPPTSAQREYLICPESQIDCGSLCHSFLNLKCAS